MGRIADAYRAAALPGGQEAVRTLVIGELNLPCPPMGRVGCRAGYSAPHDL